MSNIHIFYNSASLLEIYPRNTQEQVPWENDADTHRGKFIDSKHMEIAYIFTEKRMDPYMTIFRRWIFLL